MAGKGGKGLLAAKTTTAKTLYALNDVSECLKSAGLTKRDQHSGLREACRKNLQHEGVQLQQLEREPATEIADQEACLGSSARHGCGEGVFPVRGERR
jgi:hypothetical protein